MRSGRLDRKIEFPLPNEDSRVQILKIHSRKMTHKEINFVELGNSLMIQRAQQRTSMVRC
jgi:26S proteasome regulatory subunit T5